MPNRTFKYLFVYKRAQSITRLISFQKHDEKTTVFRDQCFQEFGPGLQEGNTIFFYLRPIEKQGFLPSHSVAKRKPIVLHVTNGNWTSFLPHR
jgi:hypothetical protein